MTSWRLMALCLGVQLAACATPARSNNAALGPVHAPGKPAARSEMEGPPSEPCSGNLETDGATCEDDTRKRVRVLLGWDSALLQDGRAILPEGVELRSSPALQTESELPTESGLREDPFLWTNTAGGIRLISSGRTSPPLPCWFEDRHVRRLSNSGKCLLTQSGEIWCHGFSRSARFEGLDDSVGLQWYRLEPRGSVRAIQVEGDSTVGCAVLRDGRLDCWVGDEAPPPLSFPTPIERVAVTSSGGYQSGYHICVLDRAGDIGCWGSGTAGQLGYMAPPGDDVDVDPEFYAPSQPATFLRLPGPARHIYALSDETCAVLRDGALWCWGNTGKLLLEGQASPTDYRSRLFEDPDTTRVHLDEGSSTLPTAPVALPADCSPKQIIPMEQAVCVLCESGCAMCWKSEPPTECLSFE